MKHQLTGYTTVTNPETNAEHTYGPDDEVPDWAKELITNPSAWLFIDEDSGETATVDDAIDKMSRDKIIEALGDMGMVPGEDFPVSATKTRLAEIFRERISSPHEET